MTYRTNTEYGTWCNRINQYSTSLEADILDYINGGDNNWQERLEASGALELIQDEYRQAINDALPDSISLSGDQFIGPAEPDDGEFGDYPAAKDGALNLKAIVEDIDLAAIVERNEPLTLEEIGRWEMNSTAKEPAKAASRALSRLGLKPHTYLPHPESNRPQAIYLKGTVQEALAKRPGKGNRTPKTAA